MPGRPLWIVSLALASIALGAMAGCGGNRNVEREPIPTFSGAATSAPSARTARETLLPTDCVDVLPGEKMAALLGQPIDAVTVRTVIGLPSPSVGQLERVTCRYQRVSGAGSVSAKRGGDPGDVVVILTAYGTPDQARNQHAVNVTAERPDARSATNLSIGSAPAVLFDEGVQDVLMVTNGRSSVDVTLRRGVVVGSTDARAVLVDLAQRVLPNLAPDHPATHGQPGPQGGPASRDEWGPPTRPAGRSR